MKVAVVGVGYVGLSTAVCLATKFRTVAVDINEGRILQLRAGNAPIFEQGLAPLLRKGLASKRLSFSTSLEGQVADVYFIAVGTPSEADGSIDLSQVKAAAASVGVSVRSSRSRPLVFAKSTAVPGSARTVVKPAIEEASGKVCGVGFGLCANPEFLKEGSAIADTLKPDRVVLGPFDSLSKRQAVSFYGRFYRKGSARLLVTSPEGAELVKYGSNALLATKVSFINMVASLCERFPGTDVGEVARGIGMDRRLGPQFLQAGPGFGGSCFPKDLRAFSKSIESEGLDNSLVRDVLEINERQPKHVAQLGAAAAGPLTGKEASVLGLAFKAGTDDVRESRSFPLIDELLSMGATVRVFDPVAIPAARKVLGTRVVYSSSAADCIKGADIAFVMTDWPEFRTISAAHYRKLMRSPILVDARRVYDPSKYAKGIQFLAVGLGGGVRSA